MHAQMMKSSNSSLGGRSTVVGDERGVALEVISGATGLVIALVGQMMGSYNVQIMDSVISGMTGIFGAFAFTNSVGLSRDLHRIIGILVGAGLASIFGPVLANYAAWRFEFLRIGYFGDAAAGCLLGLVSTPVLGFLRNPIPGLTFAMTLIPWIRKKEDK